MSNLEREYEELILTLPRAEGWFSGSMYEYQGSWYTAEVLKTVISCQKHFEAGDGDVFLATYLKSGTIWLKAIMFSLLNRAKHPPLSPNHPLHTHNPHELVSQLEISTDEGFISSPRMFGTHFPYSSLPESIRSNRSCKIVYVCRDPKDVLVSLWIFTNKMIIPQEVEKKSIEDVFELFCKGVTPYGAFWEHILQYWKQMKENPHGVLFLTYESMKEQPEVHIRHLADFLGCPFSAEEEESGIPTQILNLCSFDSLRNMEANKNGNILFRNIGIQVEKNTFFRRGEIGDWKNHLSAEMADRLDQIIRQKFSASGLFI